MKKILSVALVALLAASTVFAAVSGSATAGFGYNFDTKDYGFIGNDKNVKFDFELATASVDKQAEGDVYAAIKASFGIVALSDQKDGVDPIIKSAFPVTVGGAVLNNGKVGFGIYAKIDSAKVAGKDWYVSILGVPSVNDFAKSAIDTWDVEGNKIYGLPNEDSTSKASYKVSYAEAPGIEAGYAGYVMGFGLKGVAKEDGDLETSVFAKTPEYEVAEGIKLQAGASYYYKKASAAVANNAVGGSVKFAYENDTLSASVASDMGYDAKAEQFDADVAAKLAISPVTVDAYYATNVKVDGSAVKNLLSAKAVVDLNAFDVPVALTVTGKDLVNKQDLNLKAAFNITEQLSASVNGGYIIDTKVWSVGGDVKYAADAFTVKAATAVKKTVDTDNMLLSASASVESAVLVPGSTLKLAWSGAKDLLDKDPSKTNYGKVIASCKIAF